MRITDLLGPRRILLGTQAAGKQEALQALLDALAADGCLKDKETFRQEVFAREEKGGTAVGGGLAIPHAKSRGVARPALAAMTLAEGIDWQAPDGAPVRLVFVIAAPADARPTCMWRCWPGCGALPDAAGMQPGAHRRGRPAGVSCRRWTAGARKSLPKTAAAARMRCWPSRPARWASPTPSWRPKRSSAAPPKWASASRLETNGADGPQNVLTEQEIDQARCIIVAANRTVESERFIGHPVLFVPVAEAVRQPERLLRRALTADLPADGRPAGPVERAAGPLRSNSPTRKGRRRRARAQPCANTAATPTTT